jgi:uncharacterized protein (TIGR03118 family)
VKSTCNSTGAGDTRATKLEETMDAMSLDHDHRHHHHHHHEDQEVAFTQTNLVSDTPGAAPTIDPNLINPWGVADSPTGPFWVSDNGTGVTTIYNGAGMPAGPKLVTVAALPGEDHSSPTGQVFNGGGGFDISSDGTTGSSLFIFATESGTISGWNPKVDPTSSVIAVDNSSNGAVYKGLAIGSNHDGTFLFAANFHNGTVDVFDQNFKQVSSFTDRHLPKGYAPFNVQVLDGHLFVTFALQDANEHDDVAGAGHGFVDEFDLKGHLLDRVASRGPLDSPWGLAIAPSGFGEFAGDLLVGNFGDGTINAFDLKDDHFEGKLLDANGAPITLVISGPSFPAMAVPTAIPTRSTLRPACRTKRMACLAAWRRSLNRIDPPCRCRARIRTAEGRASAHGWRLAFPAARTCAHGVT